MLPFYNKSEFQVIIDMPDGIPTEKTTGVAQALGSYLGQKPEVINYQIYAGTSGPYNFNGLVRHYFLRRQPNQADIQVNLLSRHERKAQSHDITRRLRPELDKIAAPFGARIKVAEVPPGPPVLQTLVAEVYGPDHKSQTELAAKIKKIFQETPGVVDVDWYVEDPQTTYDMKVDLDKAALQGFSAAEITRTVQRGLSGAIDKIQLSDGYQVKQYSGTVLPERTDRLAMKWDGEWHITVEVFRDLGLAFAAVLVLIYVLVVGWFRSFKTPLVIMAPIPLTLVGILPAHALMGAFFTATSMIGFIAGAGIIVRNSIILVDFIELRRSQGMSLEEAVVDAGAVRFRPMLLTAAAVVVGASVILLDPIFQGLALSLMAGQVSSTALSRMTVPVLYYLSQKGHSLPPPSSAF